MLQWRWRCQGHCCPWVSPPLAQCWLHCEAWSRSWCHIQQVCLGSSMHSLALWSLSSCGDPSWLWNLNGGNAGRCEWGCPGPLAATHHLVMAWAINCWPSHGPNALVLSWACLSTQLGAPHSVTTASHASPNLNPSPSNHLPQNRTPSVRPDLPSWSMSPPLAPARCVWGGGVAPPSLVKITWISKQYQVLGQSGISLFTGEWDGECDGALPVASISLGPFWPFSGVRVWPSIWTVAPYIWSCRSLDWALMQKYQL